MFLYMQGKPGFSASENHCRLMPVFMHMLILPSKGAILDLLLQFSILVYRPHMYMCEYQLACALAAQWTIQTGLLPYAVAKWSSDCTMCLRPDLLYLLICV